MNWFVPTTSSVLSEFAKLKAQLLNVIDYHDAKRTQKLAEVNDIHEPELNAAHRALKAVEQFI